MESTSGRSCAAFRCAATMLMMLGALCLGGRALAQAGVPDSVSAPAAPMAPASAQPAIPAPAAAPGPIVVPAEPRSASADAKFTSGNLVFLEGLFFYTRWQEEPDPYYTMSGYQPPRYEYTETVVAGIASCNHVFTNGLSFGGSFGLVSLSTSQKLLSGHEYYYSGDYTSSASINLIGPRIGYYFTKLSGKITPFVAFEYDIVSGSYNFSQNLTRIGGGVLIQVAPSAAISVGVDYVDISEQKNATNVMGLVGMNFLLK